MAAGARARADNTPAAAERVLAALLRAGRVRKVVIPTLVGAGTVGGGEMLVQADVWEGMVMASSSFSSSLGVNGLAEDVKRAFVAWSRTRPGALKMEGSEVEAVGLGMKGVDALVRAGFLTAVNGNGDGCSGRGMFARPEERCSLISLERVSRAAAGTVAAVGGEGVLHAAGGTGARNLVGSGVGTGAGEGHGGGYSIAVPGSGMFIKLVSAALEHLEELLRKTQYREMPESDLRERWDGGVVGDSEIAMAKKARGEFVGVVPGKTKKWKEFQGLSFDWVLREAVGAGLVEVFETRSVGRAVRLV
ncbi:hypothetical protein VTI74DRAFT_138 [Chaetomium olivicolor]